MFVNENYSHIGMEYRSTGLLSPTGLLLASGKEGSFIIKVLSP